MDQLQYDTVTSASSGCALCRQQVLATQTFCSNCGYPQNGTEEQKSAFQTRRESKKAMLREARKNIGWATTVLAIVAVFTLIGGAIIGLVQEDYLLLVISLAIAAVYGALAFISSKKPFPAILTGFILYITLIAINGLVDPATLVSGFIWKIIFIIAFIKGISAARKAEQLERELAK